MKVYWMTEYDYSMDGNWTRCKATTLTGAKREATRCYRGTYADHVLCVGIGGYDLSQTGSPVIVSSRRAARGSRWHDD